MIVLHAGLLDRQLWIWGEAPLTEPFRGRSRRRVSSVESPLPYDAGAKALTKALGEVFAWKIPTARSKPLTAWLPTTTSKGLPLASSALIAEPPEGSETLEIAPWVVSALPLRADQVIEFLLACLDKPILDHGLIVGSTAKYWTDALRWAGSMVARQRFLPTIRGTEVGFLAAWEPVLDGDDVHRVLDLTRRMPHACRALARDNSTPPNRPAGDVLSTFLDAMVDHLVRSSAEEAILARASTKTKTQTQTQDKAGRKTFHSVHDRWLHALRTPNPKLAGNEPDLEALVQQIAHWRRPIAVAAATPFRLCFRLEEPAQGEEGGTGSSGNGNGAIIDGQDGWQVRYLLQAADDPSLLVPVQDAWTARGQAAKLFRKGKFNPREYLLSALGQAASLCPRIEESLKDAAPGGYMLNAQAAHEFLLEKSWLLEQAGYGVLLPAWWTRKGTKNRLQLKAHVKTPKLQTLAGLSLDEILRFQWKIAIGDQELTLAELKALAKLKTPLVRVRGQWVQLSAEEIQEALEFWKKKAPKAPARKLVHMALGMGKPEGALEFEGIEAEGWMDDLLQQLSGQSGFEALDPPEGFRGTLRPYQQRGYSWLQFLGRWGFGACLADDMGLGKTVQALVHIRKRWESGDQRPTLLICPMSVVGNWQREAEKFTPELPVMVHHGLTRVKKSALFKKQAAEQAIVLSSYALLHRDEELFQKVDWAGVILDEAQNIKNPETKQARAARELKADYRVALTGTPVENHVGDLWSLMEFLNPGLLGTQSEFKRSFHVPIQAYQDPDATKQLQSLTAPFILRRVKTDKSIIADLPDKLEMKVFCNLTKEQVSLYEAVAEEAARQVAEAEGIQRKGIVLATLSKLKQVCNHPVQFLGDNSSIPDRSGKLARLTEMLEEALEAGDRALIFSQFSEMGDILRRHLQETFGREVLFLHGGVPKKKRDQMVERFQSDVSNAPPLFVLSLKAGGTGLNLTAANHVFHFDRWWNPAVENQATDRAFRIGQKKKVQVHKFLCAGTLEEKIDEMITLKQQISGSIVGTGEDWLTKLSTAELRDLFSLRREALAD